MLEGECPGRKEIPSPFTFRPSPFGGIAQLVERLLCKQEVAGSNPTASTSNIGTILKDVRFAYRERDVSFLTSLL